MRFFDHHRDKMADAVIETLSPPCRACEQYLTGFSFNLRLLIVITSDYRSTRYSPAPEISPNHRKSQCHEHLRVHKRDLLQIFRLRRMRPRCSSLSGTKGRPVMSS